MEHIRELLEAQGYQQNTPSHPMTPELSSLNERPRQERLPLEMAQRLNVNPEHTFESFKGVSGGKSLVQTFKSVLSGPRFMLLIYGGVGNGKTHLLEASAIELYKQGKFARVMLFSQMLSTLKASISNPEMSYESILTNYCYGERLIMDDVGAGGTDTEFGDRILEAIACARYGRQLLTLMATNRDIESLPERVISRLKDKSTSYLVLNKGADYRLKMTGKSYRTSP